jgi:hypothetical protein
LSGVNTSGNRDVNSFLITHYSFTGSNKMANYTPSLQQTQKENTPHSDDR